MTKARPQVLSLNGGEVDEEAIARSDMDSYANKAQVFENAIPAIKGGLFRAPGSRFIGHTLPGLDGDLPAIVRSWRFTRTQAFTLELSHTAMRIVYGAGYVETGPGAAVFGTWNDSSSGGGGTTPDPPTWDNDPGGPSGGDYNHSLPNVN